MARRPYGSGSQMKNGEAPLLTEPIHYQLTLTQKRRMVMKRYTVKFATITIIQDRLEALNFIQ